MFKVLVLQSLYNLADEQLEFQIRDRLSFMRFLGLGVEDRVPDATTVWRFREDLKELDLMERLFNRFGDYLEAQGYQARSGQIVDASIVRAPVPRPRPTCLPTWPCGGPLTRRAPSPSHRSPLATTRLPMAVFSPRIRRPPISAPS